MVGFALSRMSSPHIPWTIFYAKCKKKKGGDLGPNKEGSKKASFGKV